MKLYDYIKKKKTYIIAEMSGNHGGELSRALEIVKYAKEAGADCLKIQTYTPDTLTLDCKKDVFLVKGGLWNNKNLYDLYKEAYTPWEWQEEIKRECDKIGIDFLSTPFDFTSVDFLESIGIEFYKIASPELIDIPLIKYVAEKKKPILISCGMGSEQEIEDAISTIRKCGNEDIIILKCCSEYPSDFSNMNLVMINEIKERFNCKVGLSDHSMGSMGAVVAVAMGAVVVEKHFCITREDKTSDSEFSMNYNEFKKMVEDIRQTEIIKGVKSYGPSEGEIRGLKNRRSIFVVKDMKKGDVFTPENVKSIRPAAGMLPVYYEEILGKRANQDIEYGTPLSQELIEDFTI